MTAASDAVLELRDLRLHLLQQGEALQVVDRVSFSIRPGEFFGLVGESGSGKTMIARAIMRLMPRERLRLSGGLTLDGVDVTRAPEHVMRSLRGRAVSMIFQEPMTSLNPIMTVERQIAEALSAHGAIAKGEQRDRIQTLLREARFTDPRRVACLYPHELSGGMRQRAMIAIALANEPKLLIADEPTTALDVTIQQEIMDILARLRESHGLAVLFISHDLALVHRNADRIGVLYGGVLMEIGPAKGVIHAPAHPYTSALLSCMPRRRAQRERQTSIEGSVPRIDEWFDGCRFAPRCAQRRPDCATGVIPLAPRRDTRSVRCLYPLT